MSVVTTARHRVAVAGHVTDRVTGKGMCGVLLAIVEMPKDFRRRLDSLALEWGTKWESMTARPDKTLTQADGLFYFLDLPQGEYKLQACCPQLGQRYGADATSVSVVRSGSGESGPVWTALSLPPTSLQGTITSRKTPVIHASVSLRGSGESVFTDTQGRYALTGIEPGKRTLLVTGQGFRPSAQTVLLAGSGQIVTTDVNLVREGA